MYIKLDRDYPVKTTRGAIREIERVFYKPFYQVVVDIANMKLQDQIKFLFNGVKLLDDQITEKVFAALCIEYLGINDIMEYLKQFVYALQYPNTTQQKTQNNPIKKMQKAQ